MAAALEYISAEILDLSGFVCTKNGKKRLTPRHLRLAIDADDALCPVFRNITLSESGITPYINPLVSQPPKALI